MDTLKDLMQKLPGLNALAASSFWDKPIDKIHPVTLQSFMKRAQDAGRRDEAETAMSICLSELWRLHREGRVPQVPMMGFRPRRRPVMMVDELREGLQYMSTVKARAVLFGLEMGMDAAGVTALTWDAAMRLFKAATMSELAIACTRACPRHLACDRVFWEDDKPLVGLDTAVFESFGMIWEELADAYSRMVMIDRAADAAAFEADLVRLGLRGDAA